MAALFPQYGLRLMHNEPTYVYACEVDNSVNTTKATEELSPEQYNKTMPEVVKEHITSFVPGKKVLGAWKVNRYLVSCSNEGTDTKRFDYCTYEDFQRNELLDKSQLTKVEMLLSEHSNVRCCDITVQQSQGVFRAIVERQK